MTVVKDGGEAFASKDSCSARISVGYSVFEDTTDDYISGNGNAS